MPFYKSILVSNIFNPYMDNTKNLQAVFNRLGKENKYRGVETRVIQDRETREVFTRHEQALEWEVVLWLTGEMNRMGLNLSSLNDSMRLKSLEEVFLFIDAAADHRGQKIGIGSDGIESLNSHDT